MTIGIIGAGHIGAHRLIRDTQRHQRLVGHWPDTERREAERWIKYAIVALWEPPEPCGQALTVPPAGRAGAVPLPHATTVSGLAAEAASVTE